MSAYFCYTYQMFTTLLLIVGVIFIISLILGIIFLIQGPPFVPTDSQTTKEIINLVKKYKGKRVIDLGSGDGKLVIALAQAGIDAHGIELNPILAWRSKQTIRKLKLQTKAHITWGNFWTVNLGKYDIVVLYGIKHIMQRLGEKMDTELPKGAYILTNFFTFPQWKPYARHERIVVYKKRT